MKFENIFDLIPKRMWDLVHLTHHVRDKVVVFSRNLSDHNGNVKD